VWDTLSLLLLYAQMYFISFNFSLIIYSIYTINFRKPYKQANIISYTVLSYLIGDFYYFVYQSTGCPTVCNMCHWMIWNQLNWTWIYSYKETNDEYVLDIMLLIVCFNVCVVTQAWCIALTTFKGNKIYWLTMSYINRLSQLRFMSIKDATY
jgi:hypothetical protein